MLKLMLPTVKIPVSALYRTEERVPVVWIGVVPLLRPYTVSDSAVTPSWRRMYASGSSNTMYWVEAKVPRAFNLKYESVPSVQQPVPKMLPPCSKAELKRQTPPLFWKTPDCENGEWPSLPVMFMTPKLASVLPTLNTSPVLRPYE